MSDRLHDRFLERPAYLDLDFIRAEIKKLDQLIEASLANNQKWEGIAARLGDPSEYADAIFASRLLSSAVTTQESRTSILAVVLKILFIVAPVNFIFAAGPLLIGLVILLAGWLISILMAAVPAALSVHLFTSVGASALFFLIAIFALGAMCCLFMMTVSRLMIRAVWIWLGWNIAFLRAEPRR